MKHTEWTTAISTSRTDYEFLSEIASYGIKGIELSVAEWLVDDIDWGGLFRNAGRANIELLSYHLPFGDKSDISALDEVLRESACEWHKALMKKANEIGITRFIIHPSYEPIDMTERDARIENAKKSLCSLAEYAKELSSVICVENLPRSCIGHDANEMKSLVEAHKELKVCFDVNHLLLEFGCSHADFVNSLSQKIVTCHMSDYDFIDEKHYFCGNGDINWDELIGLLESIGYQGPFLYEGGFAPHRVHKEVPYGKYSDAYERQQKIRSFKGKSH